MAMGSLSEFWISDELWEEGVTCSEMGDVICIDKAAAAAESEEESAVEEMMQTNHLFDVCSRMFLAKLNNLFSRQYHHEYTSEYSIFTPFIYVALLPFPSLHTAASQGIYFYILVTPI